MKVSLQLLGTWGSQTVSRQSEVSSCSDEGPEVRTVSCLIKTFCQSKPIYDISCLGANTANSRLWVRQGSTTGDCVLFHRSTTPCPILWVTNCGAGL